MEMGETEPVLLAYETHSRLLSADAQAADDAPVPVPVAPVASKAAIVSATVAGLDEEQVQEDAPLLPGPDLEVTITVRGRGDEQPHVGFMIEQTRGVGITSMVTHEEGAAPRRLPDGTWRIVLTLPELPLHSGDYVVSVYLFDHSGLVVYDQWHQFLRFRFVAPVRTPGLVRLPHHWS